MKLTTTALVLGLGVLASAAPLLSHEVQETNAIDTRSHHSEEPQPTTSINVDDVPDSYYWDRDFDLANNSELPKRAWWDPIKPWIPKPVKPCPHHDFWQYDKRDLAVGESEDLSHVCEESCAATTTTTNDKANVPSSFEKRG